MKDIKVHQQGNMFKVGPHNPSAVMGKLPAGTYDLKFHPDEGFYAQIVQELKLPKKMYADVDKNAARIMQTFISRDKNTGVLLSGEKGSGKTLLSKVIAHKALEVGYPVLLLNFPAIGDSFKYFLNGLGGPAIVIIDEFEKVYDSEHQEQFLTILDGVSTSNCLFLLTVNNQYALNQFLNNRPGRIYYHLSFDGKLSDTFITEYCNDRLNNKKHIPQIIKMVTMSSKFNFDMLQALIEEMNRYDESPLDAIKLLNVKFDTGVKSFEGVLFINGVKQNATTTVKINPLDCSISFNTDKYLNMSSEEEESVNIYRPDGRYKDEYVTMFTTKDMVSISNNGETYEFSKENGKYKAVLNATYPKQFGFNDVVNF